MFVNLSNHPSRNWSEEQTLAANEFGSIEDFVFPNIPVEYTSYDVDKLAYTIYQSILKVYGPCTCMVQGEMTFVHSFVKYAKMLDKVLCVAACSERQVKEKDGKKIVTFKFVQFREYA